MNTALDGLLSIVADGDDLEMSKAIAFYPPNSAQIKVPKSCIVDGKKVELPPDDYLAELPFVAGQFVVMKDESPARRVSYDSYLQTTLMPLVRVFPCALWLVGSAVLDPFLAFGNSDLGQIIRFPGLWDHPVSDGSVKPTYEIKNGLAIYNEELRQWRAKPDYCDNRPSAPYSEKSYIVFSLLRTSEGMVDVPEDVLREQTEYIGKLVADPMGLTLDTRLRKISEVMTSMTSALAFQAIQRDITTGTVRGSIEQLDRWVAAWKDATTDVGLKDHLRRKVLSTLWTKKVADAALAALEKSVDLTKTVKWDPTRLKYVFLDESTQPEQHEPDKAGDLPPTDGE
jgi:hypothetical protein